MTTPPLEYRIPFLPDANGPIAWEQVPPASIGHFLWLGNGYAPETEVRLCWTPERLHIRFRVREADPTVRYLERNGPVYQDSCVELFVQPCPETDPRYLNFELNARGTLLLQLGAGREDRRFLRDGESDDLFAIRSAIHPELPSSAAGCWELEFSIPFRWLQGYFPDFRPESGWLLRGNFYKCGDDTPVPHYGCWSRVTSGTPDFHRSCDFGLLELALR
ncbi:carbohydrate-binding family 9-like protein [Gorillibacterium sp. sgz5001074]|uniref:carbohydrate-binding family 9-like protein n=1 Tax=Gorillibacterium sp. sgz5001074 TaxID=3446695 RepID=UPI003F67ED00